MPVIIIVQAKKAYKNTSKAMFIVNQQMFNPLPKSYFKEVDIDILNQCRTIPPAGKLHIQLSLQQGSTLGNNKKGAHLLFRLGETVTYICL